MCHQEFTSALLWIFPPTHELSSDVWHVQLLPYRIVTLLWLRNFDYAALFFFGAFYQWISHVDMPQCYLYSRDRNQLGGTKRRYEILMAVNVKRAVFWDMILYRLIDRYKSFRRTCCPHLKTKELYSLLHWQKAYWNLVGKLLLLPTIVLNVKHKICYEHSFCTHAKPFVYRKKLCQNFQTRVTCKIPERQLPSYADTRFDRIKVPGKWCCYVKDTINFVQQKWTLQ
jgi:hypothetical protein